MLNTYLNDNQSMPYPFYGLGSLPFAMSVITGMGLCIKTSSDDDPETQGINRLFASNVQISKDSVNVAICRKNSLEGFELIGMFYARTDGYYMYLPGYAEWQDDAVYEDQTIEPQMLRWVYHGDVDAYNEMIDNDQYVPVFNLQTFYSYIASSGDTALSSVMSTGYIQLGSIPEAAIGNYSGEFYLDPSCVTYMPETVYRGYDKYTIGSTEYKAGQRIDLSANGLLRFAVEGGTVFAAETTDADKEQLVELTFEGREQVTGLRGYPIAGTTANPYPTLTLKGDGNLIRFNVTHQTDPVVIEVIGTTAFPNCDRGD